MAVFPPEALACFMQRRTRPFVDTGGNRALAQSITRTIHVEVRTVGTGPVDEFELASVTGE